MANFSEAAHQIVRLKKKDKDWLRLVTWTARVGRAAGPESQNESPNTNFYQSTKIGWSEPICREFSMIFKFKLALVFPSKN